MLALAMVGRLGTRSGSPRYVRQVLALIKTNPIAHPCSLGDHVHGIYLGALESMSDTLVDVVSRITSLSVTLRLYLLNAVLGR